MTVKPSPWTARWAGVLVLALCPLLYDSVRLHEISFRRAQRLLREHRPSPDYHLDALFRSLIPDIPEQGVISFNATNPSSPGQSRLYYRLQYALAPRVIEVGQRQQFVVTFAADDTLPANELVLIDNSTTSDCIEGFRSDRRARNAGRGLCGAFEPPEPESTRGRFVAPSRSRPRRRDVLRSVVGIVALGNPVAAFTARRGSPLLGVTGSSLGAVGPEVSRRVFPTTRRLKQRHEPHHGHRAPSRVICRGHHLCGAFDCASARRMGCMGDVEPSSPILLFLRLSRSLAGSVFHYPVVVRARLSIIDVPFDRKGLDLHQH